MCDIPSSKYFSDNNAANYKYNQFVIVFYDKLLIFITITIVRYLTMGIKRKVRMCGESLAITIPSQIAQMHNIKEGDYMEFEPIGSGEFRIKNVEN